MTNDLDPAIPEVAEAQDRRHRDCTRIGDRQRPGRRRQTGREAGR